MEAYGAEESVAAMTDIAEARVAQAAAINTPDDAADYGALQSQERMLTVQRAVAFEAVAAKRSMLTSCLVANASLAGAALASSLLPQLLLPPPTSLIVKVAPPTMAETGTLDESVVATTNMAVTAALVAQLARPLPFRGAGWCVTAATLRARARALSALAASLALPTATGSFLTGTISAAIATTTSATAVTPTSAVLPASSITANRLALIPCWLDATLKSRLCDEPPGDQPLLATTAIGIPIFVRVLFSDRNVPKTVSCTSSATVATAIATAATVCASSVSASRDATVTGATGGGTDWGTGGGSCASDGSAATVTSREQAIRALSGALASDRTTATAIAVCGMLASPLLLLARPTPLILVLHGYIHDPANVLAVAPSTACAHTTQPSGASTAAASPAPAAPAALSTPATSLLAGMLHDRLATAICAALEVGLGAIASPPSLVPEDVEPASTVAHAAIRDGVMQIQMRTPNKAHRVDALLRSTAGSDTSHAESVAAATDRGAALQAWWGLLARAISFSRPLSSASTAMASLALSSSGTEDEIQGALNSLFQQQWHLEALAVLSHLWLPSSPCATATPHTSTAKTVASVGRRRRLHALQLTRLCLDHYTAAASLDHGTAAAVAADLASPAAFTAVILSASHLTPLLLAVACEADALLAGAALAALAALNHALAATMIYAPAATAADAAAAPKTTAAAPAKPPPLRLSAVPAMKVDALKVASAPWVEPSLLCCSCSLLLPAARMQALCARLLPTSGKKADLAARLSASLSAAATTAEQCAEELHADDPDLTVGSTVVKVAIARGQLICSILTAISNSVASATLATISTSGEAIDYLVAHVSATLAVLVPTASAPLSTATPAAFTAAAAAATSCALLRSFLGLRRMRMEADVNGMLATRRSEFEHVTTDMRLVAEVEAVCTTCATIVPWALALIRASTSQHPPSAAANLFAAAQEAMALVIEVTKWMPLTTPLACSIANAAAVADTCVTVASSSPSPLVPSCLYALTFLGSVRSVPLSCLALPLAAAATLRPGFVATLPPTLQLHLFVCHVDALRRCSSILVPPTSSVAAVHAAAAAHTAAAAAASYVASLRTTTSLLPVSACAVVQSLLERSPTQTLRTPDAHVDDRWLDDAILSIELIASHCVAEMSSLLPQLFSILAIAADGWSSAITPPAVASASIAVTLVAATDGSTAVSMPSASEAEIGAVAVRDARKVGSDGDESSRFASLVALTVAATCDAVSDLSTASTVTAASLAVTTAAAATDAVGQALGPRSALLLRCLTAAELGIAHSYRTTTLLMYRLGIRIPRTITRIRASAFALLDAQMVARTSPQTFSRCCD